MVVLLALTACSSLMDQIVDVDSVSIAADDRSASAVFQAENQLVDQVPLTHVVSPESSISTSSYDLEAALINLYQQANPAVVYIIVSGTSSGSGFVYDRSGYIVTNYHVVASGRSYEVVFSTGERMSAELIGVDEDSDLAVIKVEELPVSVEPLSLAQPSSLQIGQFVVAIGNPFGEQGSLSLGIVSGLDRSLPSQRELTAQSTYSLPEVIQTDAAINPGNSGGPLLNLAGQVVGVNAAIASSTGTSSGVGFSIPVSAVRLVVPALIEAGEYQYPYIGASFDSEVSLEEQVGYGLTQIQGAYVVGVIVGGPADQAGLVPADPTTGRGGDLIVRIDDEEIRNFSDLNSYLVLHTQVGQTLQITALRGDELVEIPLNLGVRP
jgi:2-alkenal reductase